MLKATDVQSKASSSMTPFTSPPPQAPPSVATKLSTAFHLPHAPPSSAGLYPISHPPTHNNNSHDGNGHGKFAPGSNSNSSFINSSLIPPPPPSSLSKGLYSTNHPIIPPPPPMIASIPSNPYQMPPTGNIPHMNSIPPPPLPGDYNNANNYSDKGDNSARSPRVDDHQNASVQSSPRYDLNTDSPRYGSVDSRPTSGPRRGNSRIDPSQMPRPPHLETDIVFYTRSGTTRRVPPLSNSGFQAIDNGNSSPRYIRATTVAPGISNVVQLSTGLPLGLIITPFASPENGEEPVPIVDYGGELPPRCSRCRGYVNCSVEWIADGNSWRCNLCSMVNAVPAW
jgi:protein transport protein SEC24